MSALIDTEQIAKILGVSRSTVIASVVKRQGFPRPVPELTARRGLQWNRDEVLSFLCPDDPKALDGMSSPGRERKPPTMRQFLVAALGNARRRSGRKDRAFQLSIEDIERLYAEQGGRCAVSGVQFSLERLGNGPAPFSPSIDRIDSGAGYVQGNVRLVCCAVNLMMNVWGESVYRRLMEAR
jgi:predicted DNA-binding transcriptional regulator AlpA